MPPLVALLQRRVFAAPEAHHDDDVVQVVISTLKHLSYGDDGDRGSCEAIVAAGGVRALTAALVGSAAGGAGSAATAALGPPHEVVKKVQAAGALANLAHEHPARSAAIVRAGAVRMRVLLS